jgi:hypothetical protein
VRVGSMPSSLRFSLSHRSFASSFLITSVQGVVSNCQWLLQQSSVGVLSKGCHDQTHTLNANIPMLTLKGYRHQDLDPVLVVGQERFSEDWTRQWEPIKWEGHKLGMKGSSSLAH